MSNIIKSFSSERNQQQNRVIQLKTLSIPQSNQALSEEEQHSLNEVASNIIQTAKNQANQLIEQAEREYQHHKDKLHHEQMLWIEEKQQLIEEARKEGFEAGFLQGQQAGFEEYEQEISLAKEIVNKAKEDSLTHIDTAEEIILALSLNIAEKIIGKQINDDQTAFLSLVKNGVKEVKEHSQISITVHPLNHQMLLDNKDELMAIMNKSSDLYIYPNHELKETDCIIESSFGRVDASVDSQLGEIKEKLLMLLLEE
ncbi:flagellar assembly protein FliH [Bacillus sp. PS06]|uniref:flagellar assembly protein FliH n=1 Tax=Bacillus sp. PS06 TaxID=2764176 RepID=UPI00177B7A2E|nr:flagellar assembly protein FliH [Bacillus sp. PS06]MBD8068300.1 flagellar assembly protein FliH [Bacillus sp. PS06]